MIKNLPDKFAEKAGINLEFIGFKKFILCILNSWQERQEWRIQRQLTYIELIWINDFRKYLRNWIQTWARNCIVHHLRLTLLRTVTVWVSLRTPLKRWLLILLLIFRFFLIILLSLLINQLVRICTLRWIWQVLQLILFAYFLFYEFIQFKLYLIEYPRQVILQMGDGFIQ